MAEESEDRTFSRSAVGNNVEIRDGDHFIGGRAKDVSMSGLFVVTTSKLAVGKDYSVSIRLDTSSDTFVRIEAGARVTRSTDAGLALEFVEIDPDSHHHLRLLVMYNANEPDSVEDEMIANPGIRGRTR